MLLNSQKMEGHLHYEAPNHEVVLKTDSDNLGTFQDVMMETMEHGASRVMLLVVLE